MIAHRSGCDVEQLRRMLTDELDIAEQHHLTRHLDTCTSCCVTLETLTADPTWWEEPRVALSAQGEPERVESTLLSHAEHARDNGNEANSTAEEADAVGDHRSHTSAPNQDHWVLPLLDPCDAPDAIGAVDSMPIQSVVGQGGMGVVLRAYDPNLRRDLAVKLLSPMLATTGAARQRFLREAQAAAAVVHPNIVPIYAVSADRKLPYLVMPYIGGGNLQQHLDEHGPLPVDRVLSIGLQVAEGLSAAHGQGIVHRDIKPANLMFDEGGFRVMLTDFGLARALDDATLTGSGMLAGTPQYMSPEQAQGRPLDHRSDLYSLGAVLYALATGRPPVRSDSTLAVLRAISEESPTSVLEINETYPAWFNGLVGRFMAKEAGSRVQTAAEASHLLRGCLAHARSPLRVALPAELKKPRRWRRAAMGLSVVAVLLLTSWIIAMCLPAGPSEIASPQSPPSQNSANSGGLPPQTAAGSQSTQDSLGIGALLTQELEHEQRLQLRQAPPLPNQDDWLGVKIDAELTQIEQVLEGLQMELGHNHVTSSGVDPANVQSKSIFESRM